MPVDRMIANGEVPLGELQTFQDPPESALYVTKLVSNCG